MASKNGPKKPPSWLKELKANDKLWVRDEEQEWALGVAEGFADGALQMKMPDGTVRKKRSFWCAALCYPKERSFTKTGSGQTQETMQKRDTRFCRWPRP